MPVDNSLLSYTGNAGLGAGSSGIDVGSPGANLNVLDKTLENIQLLTADRNMKMFQQKVKDRDFTNQQIAEGEVSMGDVDPKDRALVNAAQKKAEDIFYANPDMINRPEVYQKYRAALRDYYDVGNHAQSRFKELGDLRQQAARETLPWKRDAILSHIKQQQDRPFWDQIDPYQQLHDLNMDNITKRGVDPITSTYNDADPLKSYTSTTFDYNQILKNKATDFLAQGEPGYDISQFHDKIAGLPQPELAKFADGVNAQIAQYNQVKGLQPGVAGYVNPIGQMVDAGDGKKALVINESAPELAAKVALGAQSNYMTKTPLIDGKERLKHSEEEQKIGVEEENAGSNRIRSNAEAAKDYAEIGKVKLEKDKLQKEITNMGGLTPSNNAFDKIFSTDLKTNPSGRQYIDGDNLSNLDLAMLGGFQYNKKDGSVLPQARLTDPEGKPRLFVGTDSKGRKYIEVPTRKFVNNSDGTTSFEDGPTKKVYKDDVLNNMNLLTTEVGTKGEKIFGPSSELPQNVTFKAGPRNGQTITLEEIKTAGYSDAQIRQLIKDGKLSAGE